MKFCKLLCQARQSAWTDPETQFDPLTRSKEVGYHRNLADASFRVDRTREQKCRSAFVKDLPVKCSHLVDQGNRFPHFDQQASPCQI